MLYEMILCITRYRLGGLEVACTPSKPKVTGSIPAGVIGCGSPVVKVSDHDRHVMSSSPVPLNTRCVGQRCTLNLSRAETSFRVGVVVRRGGAGSGVVHVT
ncbi:hypothetical protein TNCV_3639821 [Trichonephila clavipes]|nr:hypothetical protein TNCV_3639821 [Trichonephila clavipes]